MARNFVMLCGGPGIFEPKDTEHDVSWSNYVDYPLLLAKKGSFPKANDEKVHWVIHKKSYEDRWADDVAKGRSSVKTIRDKGFSSYVDLLEKRAAGYGWTLKWINDASGFWSYLRSLSANKISRVWYFGHARDDLWFYITHQGSDAYAPASTSIVRRNDIKAELAALMEAAPSAYDTNKSSKFYGCNTAEFAKKWASTFKVYAEGAIGKVKFQDVHTTGKVGLSSGCRWVGYKADGSEFAP